MIKINHFFCVITSIIFLSGVKNQAGIIEISDENHLNLLLNSNQPIVVKFSADAWCGACKVAQAPFEELSNEEEFKNVQFAHVDIDGLGTLASKHAVVGVPTFMYMERGNKKGEMVGFGNVVAFKDDMRNHMRSNFNLASAQGLSSIPATSVDFMSSTSEDATPIQEQTPQTEKGGIIATLKDLITRLWNGIFYWFTYIVEKIKSLF